MLRRFACARRTLTGGSCEGYIIGGIAGWCNLKVSFSSKVLAEILKETLQKKELESLATLNWYDSGQLTAAFHYEYPIGVIGPNSNHFKHIDLTKKNFTTLIDVRLIHSDNHIDLLEQIQPYGYNIKNKVDIPYHRGMRKYGVISVISIEKISRKF